MRTQHLRDRKRTAARTARETRGGHGVQIRKQTVLRRLKERGIQTRRTYVGPKLTRRHRQARLTWCRNRRYWNAAQWRQILYTDESRFSLEHADGRTRVFRRTGERYADACVVEADRFRVGSMMVRGGISHNGKTQLVTVNGPLSAQKYRDDILAPVVLPFMQAGNGVTILQQGNARSHTARATTQFLTANNVNVMEWQSISPDLSPIEHIRDELDRRVRARPNQPTNLPQRQATLLQEWNNLPNNIVRRYIRFMRNRCRAVINSNGGYTRY